LRRQVALPARHPGRRGTPGLAGRLRARPITVPGTPTRRWQRSTVKTSYARNGRGSPWRAHGTYLAREGAQREGRKGLGFDAERDDIDIAGTLRAWQTAGDERLWKLVVSPEHGASLDLREHTRALVEHMQRDLGSRLEWVAIDHYNTDNPHVHLLVRGRDQDGQGLRMRRDYLTAGLRYRSQALATQRLGFRSDREILATRGQAVERTRFTELDRVLLRRADARGIVQYPEPGPPGRRREAEKQELRRLGFLETAGLAEKIASRTWQLRPEMETALRQAQLLRDVVKSRAQHRRHLTDPELPLTLTRLEVGTRITGRIVGSGWTDELQDHRYVLLEGTDARLHYIPLPRAMGRSLRARRLGTGEVVTLTGQAIERPGRRDVQIGVERERGPVGIPGRTPQLPGRVPELPAASRTSRGQAAPQQPIRIVEPLDGVTFRGRLVGYRLDRDGRRYAVLDTIEPELKAFRTDDADVIVGRQVRVKGRQVVDGQRLVHVWRLLDVERERERGREL
jgi:type IV secretory pathway VirD2 relaxase